jgi:hypothetical protein
MSDPAVMGSPYAAQPRYDAVHSQQAEERITLLVTTVDIGEGRAGRIEVCLGDDSIDVATAFCARHGLPEAIVLPLAQHLEENLAENEAAAAEAAGTPDSGRYAVQSGVQVGAQVGRGTAEYPALQIPCMQCWLLMCICCMLSLCLGTLRLAQPPPLEPNRRR